MNQHCHEEKGCSDASHDVSSKIVKFVIPAGNLEIDFAITSRNIKNMYISSFMSGGRDEHILLVNYYFEIDLSNAGL